MYGVSWYIFLLKTIKLLDYTENKGETLILIIFIPTNSENHKNLQVKTPDEFSMGDKGTV